MELSGGKWIGLVGSAFMFSFPIGYVISASISYNTKNWRHLHYASSILSVFLLSSMWSLPESPRWLWIRRKCQPLRQLIEDALIINGAEELDHNIILALNTEGPMKYPPRELRAKLSSLISRKVIRKRMVIAVPLFFVIYLCYYGCVLRLNKMYNPKKIFKAHLYSGLIEFAATASSLSLVARAWLNDCFILFVSTITAGTLSLFVNALPSDSMEVTYCMMGIRFFMAIVNTHILNYIVPLFPTQIRGIGISCLNSYTFLALLVIAYGFELEHFKGGVIMFMMGISGIVGGFLFLLVPAPESHTLDTIEEMERPIIQRKPGPEDYDVAVF